MAAGQTAQVVGMGAGGADAICIPQGAGGVLLEHPLASGIVATKQEPRRQLCVSNTKQLRQI